MYNLLTTCLADKGYQIFCDYILNNYITEDSRFPPQVYAECLLVWQTNNSSESFYSKLNSSLDQSHPNIFVFIKVLG